MTACMEIPVNRAICSNLEMDIRKGSQENKFSRMMKP
jgi:hypothetical protein